MSIAMESAMRFIANTLRFCFAVLSGANAASAPVNAISFECSQGLYGVTADVGIPAKSTKPAIGLAGLAMPQARTTITSGGKHFDQIPTGLHSRAIFTGESRLLSDALLNNFKTVTIDTQIRRLVLRPL